MNAPRPVVIVGGGAAGTLAALHLVSRGLGAREIVVVEPREQLGEGTAYGTRLPSHLLNVRANGMSAFADRPSHFTDWAGGTGLILDGSEFLPRPLYARYLRDALAAALMAAPGARLRHARARATRLMPTADDGYRVRTSEGIELDAASVVLATGNGWAPLAWLPDRAGVIRDPWAPAALDGIDREARVVIAGSGLTAVDVVLALLGHGHRGHITMISSHGLLPQVHAPGILPSRPTVIDPGTGASARELVRVLRQDADLADDWRQTVDGTRPVTVSAWRALPRDEQRRALRHAFRHWEVRRHRMAPQVGARMEALHANGRLAVVRGRVRGVTTAHHALAVELRSGGSDTTVPADVVVACVGPSTDPVHDPLLAVAIGDGLVVRHPLGMGLAVDAAGHPLGPDGRARPDLWTVGSLRKGAEWESTAVPELRRHAADIATALTLAD